MRLIRYKPNRIAARVGRDFDSVFESFFGNPWFGQSANGEFVPRIDVTEDKDKMELRAEIPGMDKDAIKVMVEDGLLTISGEKKSRKEEKDTGYIWSEISNGSFSRSFTLPDHVDIEKIEADYKDGLLTLVLPKTEKSKPKEIEVKIN